MCREHRRERACHDTRSRSDFEDVGWREAGNASRQCFGIKLEDERHEQGIVELGYRAGTASNNEACSLSLNGDKAAALDALQRSLENGFDQPDMFRTDDDLDNIRGERRFQELKHLAEELEGPSMSWEGHLFKSEQRHPWPKAGFTKNSYRRPLNSPDAVARLASPPVAASIAGSASAIASPSNAGTTRRSASTRGKDSVTRRTTGEDTLRGIRAGL